MPQEPLPPLMKLITLYELYFERTVPRLLVQTMPERELRHKLYKALQQDSPVDLGKIRTYGSPDDQTPWVADMGKSFRGKGIRVVNPYKSIGNTPQKSITSDDQAASSSQIPEKMTSESTTNTSSPKRNRIVDVTHLHKGKGYQIIGVPSSSRGKSHDNKS